MFDYFRGWKRKTGLVTLSLLCVLTVLWTRTFHSEDVCGFKAGGRKHILTSSRQGVDWLSIPKDANWKWFPHGIWLQTHGSDYAGNPPDSTMRSFQFERRPETGQLVVGAPYWSLMLPLTILSAWLLLSKRRQPTKPGPSQESAA